MSPSPISEPTQPNGAAEVSSEQPSARTLANRANAQKSTGPKTAEGKRHASMNAMRHGLTSQRVILEEGDERAYITHGRRWLDRLKPVGFIEIKLAQKVVDTDWQLDRCFTIDQNMFGLGIMEHSVDNGMPLTPSLGIAQARTFLAEADAFAKLSLYRTRIERSFEKSLKMLRAEQALRKENDALPEAEPLANTREEEELINWYKQFYQPEPEPESKAPESEPAPEPKVEAETPKAAPEASPNLASFLQKPASSPAPPPASNSRWLPLFKSRNPETKTA
jgi:hypothetical protein